jgi:dTDP-4-dehydrorhamnose reductase
MQPACFHQPAGDFPLEMWAGVECTVNRLGERYFDQLERNGHAQRMGDLDRFAELGIRAIRYPVLWERTAPNGPEQADWSWPDARLLKLRALGIRPIAGLLHHGSGPQYTSLMDERLPEKLADYARAVAERYPWLDAYTPVNEPLTTARFSGLYGHWYPHGRDERTFARCLLNECKGTILAMRAIRQVNPAAQLIQTDDLGKVYSTPLLAYQAAFENERRWLGYDLLTGKVAPGTMMWDYLRHIGVSEAELGWFLENPCPPDIIGINHYLTSDRYLDENLQHYPAHMHGGNGKHAYADIEAIRAHPADYAGHRTLLKDAYERYGLPVAITEAHLGCTREEQVRWLYEIWNAAKGLHEEGIPVRAVTAWSLLGAFDWNSLVTQENGFYEPGVYDLRGGEPRPTALVHVIKSLAREGDYRHPILQTEGWWRRPDRLMFPATPHCCHQLSYEEDVALPGGSPVYQRPLIIIGANGTLGRAFGKICDVRGLPYYLLSRQDLDISNVELVERVFKRLHPWAVINAAGYVRVDDAERERDLCWRDNVLGPANLAIACAEQGIPLLTFSSDLVFCGTARHLPYLESDPVNPLNVYGESKAEAERRVLEAHPESLVVRTSSFFGPWDDYNFVTLVLRTLSEGRAFVAAEDTHISPTYVPDLVNSSLDLLIDQEHGLWHLSNPSELSWAALARLVAEKGGYDSRRVEGRLSHELPWAAARPGYSVLGTERCRQRPGAGIRVKPFPAILRVDRARNLNCPMLPDGGRRREKNSPVRLMKYPGRRCRPAETSDKL